MKKATVLLWILFLGNYCYSQEVKLRILGYSSYTINAEGQVHSITFENNPLICNPITRNKPIKTQVSEFIAKLTEANIVYKFQERKENNNDPEVAQTFDLFLPFESINKNVENIISLSGITLNKSYYKFPKAKPEDEDKKAILCFKNAEKKAQALAKLINCEVTTVLNIDDDTSDANTIFELLDIPDIDDEEKEMYLKLFEQLSAIENKNDVDKNGAYSLWVTYIITPIK
ncbi:MAG: hypothetical protein V4535_01875 [Bacteroidota bacterium]